MVSLVGCRLTGVCVRVSLGERRVLHNFELIESRCSRSVCLVVGSYSCYSSSKGVVKDYRSPVIVLAGLLPASRSLRLVEIFVKAVKDHRRSGLQGLVVGPGSDYRGANVMLD